TDKRLNAMTKVIETQGRLTKADEALASMRKLLETLRTDLDTRSQESSHLATVAELDDQVLAAERECSTHRAAVAELERASGVYESFAGLGMATDTDATCPTCGRPIQDHERKHTQDHVAQVLAANQKSIGILKREIASIDATITSLRANRQTMDAFQLETRNLQGRIEIGAGKIESQEQARDQLAAELAGLLKSLALVESPSGADVEAIQSERNEQDHASKVHTRLVELEQLLQTAIAAQSDASAKLASLPMVDFAESELTNARTQLDRAKAAAQRILEITKQVLRRAEHDATIQRANGERTEAVQQLATVQAAIDALVFDPEDLTKAESEVREARQAERRATATREAERSQGIRIGERLKQIDLDEKRLGDRLQQADAAKVLADELDRMYSEFNSFEQYVSRRVRPQLEDLTSDLVRTITEGKYDGVALDDDYGITVADGDLGFFPIAEFSGGERDVISLAARLALSQLIGSQAVNPPSFLVLDEVFGSLDRERRASVLELLNVLAGTAEAFRQLFVISHVDDVRLSSSFSEVWRVVEDTSGFSTLENMSLTAGIEDV
ncbi:MAG TPA: SMC family ATPase, partial [Thermomicrobiales bacterium]|nr:SMC family ATPase [Thermomicrobiales bacterium]